MKKVVVFNRDQGLVRTLARLVRDTGDCEPVTCVTRQEAIDAAFQFVPDLVVMGYDSAGEGCKAFIQALRALPGRRWMNTLVIGDGTDPQAKYLAFEHGANDYIGLPLDPLDFISRVKNLAAMNFARKQIIDHALYLTGEVRKATRLIEARERETVFRLSMATEFRDPETGSHILRMANYSKIIARELGMPSKDQQLILEAAPMHDIGKVGISDAILLKPGRLDPQEFESMKLHSMYGYQLLHGSSSRILQTGAEIARGHHERYDGTGYPDRLKGDDIPIFSRIVAVADVFDALTSERPYKAAWSVERARDFVIEAAGKHFDPQCVQAFLTGWDSMMDVRDKYREDPLSDVAPFACLAS